MYPAVVPEDSCGIFRHALSGAGLIFPHHRPRILAAPEIRPGIITAPLSNEPGFSYIGSDQDTPRDKTGPRLFLHTTFPIFDCVSDTPARQNASKLAFALAYSYIGFAQDTPSRHNQTFLRFASAPDFSYIGLRPRYSRSAKCKRACFCPRLFVSLAPP